MTKPIAEALATSLTLGGVLPYHKDSTYDGSTEPAVDGYVYGHGAIAIPGTIALITGEDAPRGMDREWGVEWDSALGRWCTFTLHDYGW